MEIEENFYLGLGMGMGGGGGGGYRAHDQARGENGDRGSGLDGRAVMFVKKQFRRVLAGSGVVKNKKGVKRGGDV